MHLLVTPSGAKLWRFRYRFGGKEKMLGLGRYPDTSLKAARIKRDGARRLLEAGTNPSAHRKAERVAIGNSSEAVARAFMETKRSTLTPATWQRDFRQVAKVFPGIGDKAISTIEAPDLLAALRKIEAKGRHDSAHRTRSICGRVFRYAIASGLAKHDITADIRDALTPVAATHYAAVTEPAKVGALLRAIDGFDGQPATCAALKLAPYVFVRPGELRAATWSELDLDAAEWRIPGERMKQRDPHIVPLARQVMKILRELHLLTGRGKYLFPAIGSGQRPLSANTLGSALHRLGYDSSEMTAHGFRSLASTLLNEQGWHPDLIELQLAHKAGDVRGIYNRAQRLAERREMMQRWADYLDALKSDTGNVVRLRALATNSTR